MTTHRLTKTRFMAGLECERRLWLQVHRPHDRQPPSVSEVQRMQTGTAFGRQVTKLFKGGVRIEAGADDPDRALEETTQALTGTAPALFEPAFVYHDVLIRADVLLRSRNDPSRWSLIEVKSQGNSAGDKPARDRKFKKHHSDMAVQLHVLEGAGVQIEGSSLAWVNSSYARKGKIDWRKLVSIEKQSQPVRNRAKTIGDEVDHALAVIEGSNMPEPSFAKTRCGACEFNRVCWGDEPSDSVIHLPGLKAKTLTQLQEAGVAHIPDIPKTIRLSATQAAARDAFEHPNGAVVDRPRLDGWLGKLEYPLHYLDFETWGPCVPPFDGTRPYMQVPFQYSLHVQAEPGSETTHHEFLAEGSTDPRPVLIERLLADIGETGSIVAHHATFERKRIEELAELSPKHRAALLALAARFVDTETPFKKRWYVHPGLLGRSSIKVVLPVMAPGLGYDDLEIADGSTASIRFGELFELKIAGEEAAQVRRDLLDYCRRDTLAMVKLVDGLRAL